MGNTNCTNLDEQVSIIQNGPYPQGVSTRCRCPLGGTFLREYSFTDFQFLETYPIGNSGIIPPDGFQTNNITYSINKTYSFPICYETFTGKPNQSEEAPILLALAGLFYLVLLLYMFVGVAIVADRFMASIEVITSVTRKVKLPKTGTVIQVRIWNDTVSNLTLMALGSSAPEILLSIIELVSTAPNFISGSLGPSTIVGSAAFNLFVISAIIVSFIPKGETRKIRGVLVFGITVFFSIFAYIWLILILLVFSPNQISILESLVTFLFFPLLVFVAYLMDKKFFLYYFFKSIRKNDIIVNLSSGIMGRGDLEHGVVKITKGETLKKNEVLLHGYSKVEHFSNPSSPNFKNSAEPIHSFPKSEITSPNENYNDDHIEHKENEVVNFETQLEKILLKRLKSEITNSITSQGLNEKNNEFDQKAQNNILNKINKQLYGTSRAAYRVNATRFLTGGKRVIPEVKENAVDQPLLSNISDCIKSVLPEGTCSIGFEFCSVTCLENCQKIDVAVIRIGDIRSSVSVDYRTEDNEAKAGSDYIESHGILIFNADVDKLTIPIPIIDDDEFELTETFFLYLENPKIVPGENFETNCQEMNESIALLTSGNAKCTVTILDDDHHGRFVWADENYFCQESDKFLVVTIKRLEGARGKVSLRVATIKGTAKPDTDYEHIDTIVTFENEEIFKEITINIVDDDEYEKSEYFYVKICSIVENDDVSSELIPSDKKTESIRNMGAPAIGELNKCTITITEDHLFKSRTDKILGEIRLGTKIGTRSWRYQFKDALYPNGISDPEDITMGISNKPSISDWILHIVSFPFKIIFALIPPPSYLKGWICFFSSITMIGIITAIIGDLASAFGCTIGLRDQVTAITLVAIGTSVPDTFASKIAAINDDTADNSIGNITGSNSVNVFLGVGLAWLIGSVIHAIKGSSCGFVVPAGSLAFSVLLFCICAFIWLFIMIIRRIVKPFGGSELGGPIPIRIASSILFISLWIIYIILSSLVSYRIINPGF